MLLLFYILFNYLVGFGVRVHVEAPAQHTGMVSPTLGAESGNGFHVRESGFALTSKEKKRKIDPRKPGSVTESRDKAWYSPRLILRTRWASF